VLWSRALLSAAGELSDGVAAGLLPGSSRWVVAPALARTLWRPALPKLEWIASRTGWIDGALDGFLKRHGGAGAQVVLVGAGYDTRALRYRGAEADFYEVDLPAVLPVKEGMAARFLAANGGGETVGAKGRALGVDLNEAAMSPPGVFSLLSGLGLDRARPTLVVCEAVCFYLSPPAKRALLADAGAFAGGNAGSALVLADSLAPFVSGTGVEGARDFLEPLGFGLTQHDSLWGGAIQFVRAEGNGGGGGEREGGVTGSRGN
jgi:O-methyltransferase involved in polyketide biosynthesis